MEKITGGLFLIAFGTLGTLQPLRIIYPFGGTRRQHSKFGINFLRFAGVMVVLNGIRFLLMGIQQMLVRGR